MHIGNLDPKKVTIAAGSQYLTGFAPDGIFNLAWNAERVSWVSGSQGDGVYVEGTDNSALLTITFLPTSPSIIVVEGLCARRAEFDTTIKDSSKDALLTIFSAQCRVQKYADISRGPSANTNTWVIIMPSADKVDE